MLNFQIKIIISSEKWFNNVVSFFLENAKKLGRPDDAKRRKKKRMAITRIKSSSNILTFLACFCVCVCVLFSVVFTYLVLSLLAVVPAMF